MLEVADIAFAYPGGAPVLDGISFRIGAGEVVALVGRNGAGKSTMLRLLNGLRKPSRGRVSVAGNDTATTKTHLLSRHIGTVFQAPEQQIFNATVKDEIAFGPRQLKLDAAALDARISAVLARMDLTDAAGLHPLDLDAAARRFVALGSVLAMEPQILLLDEPQRGLDARAVARLEGVIVEASARGVAVVIVCHDMEFVARMASRVLALADGRLAADCTPAEFFADEALTRRCSVEVPDTLRLSEALGLAPSLTPATLAEHWLKREAPALG